MEGKLLSRVDKRFVHHVLVCPRVCFGVVRNANFRQSAPRLAAVLLQHFNKILAKSSLIYILIKSKLLSAFSKHLMRLLS